MNWGDARFLYLLVLAPMISILVLLSVSRQHKRMLAFIGEKSANQLLQSVKRQGFLRSAVLTLAFICICVALARPQWGYEWRNIEQKGADIMVVVDVSKSMNAEDIAPSRLQRARREIIDLVSKLQGDRIGLLQFAGVGFVQCPLTLDYQAMELFLDHLGGSMIPVQGSAIGSALRLAQKSLLNSEQEGSVGKSIILITDGEDHESQPLDAAKQAAAAGIKVYTIGIGSDAGAPIPDGNGGYVKDSSGRMVMSRLDASTLKEIARITGGHYVRSTTGDLDLDVIYKQHIRSDLSGTVVRESREKVWHERYWIFAVLAIGFLLVDSYYSQAQRLIKSS